VANDIDSPKGRAAFAGASLVESGMIVGLGSGSTAVLMVRFLADRVAKARLKIKAVSTSRTTGELAHSLGIPVVELDEVGTLDLNLDGADEVDPEFRMIKGLGAALLREKIVARAAARRVNMITADKRVARLGTRAPIPVEVSAFGMKHTERLLQDLGASTSIRHGADGRPTVTDGGNVIVDCRFPALSDPTSLDCQLQCVVGVLETGLFIGLCDLLIVATDEGVQAIESGVARQA
jgi:ribose 5-phosphate isomerase A